jgi:hypothetical protein
MILAIDPGNIDSAYVLMSNDCSIIRFGKIKNEELNSLITSMHSIHKFKYVVIEMIASYGMAVGATVFDTCVWVGRFTETASRLENVTVDRMYRKDVKVNLCQSMKAKDGNIRQALIDRFGVVGTKSNKGWFYGFAKDVWAAYAVGVTYIDLGGYK